MFNFSYEKLRIRFDKKNKKKIIYCIIKNARNVGIRNEKSRQTQGRQTQQPQIKEGVRPSEHEICQGSQEQEHQGQSDKSPWILPKEE